jgi:ssDNA-binding Zn-finger/Zn-ribbon topoisomerase 1
MNLKKKTVCNGTMIYTQRESENAFVVCSNIATEKKERREKFFCSAIIKELLCWQIERKFSFLDCF